ncbi:hypothetical protein [Enterobacillus tribolii]|uniref:Uncharacterized protein n=1 Tax=Enterobacillus tribolii TaxID=1487935 RepID=A0A370QGK7_9GAMM|nr:hypothetical protein [Enterobacillus tribolii]MBW7981810.1 hypothetical protein [Enterobacillus tribolii]RDK87491.1 hypothetical protein C8D90_10986 [Enterobacillus tribolii]
MENTLFARIAAIVGSASLKKPILAVYNNATRHYVSVAADTTRGKVSGYDTSARCYFSGNSTTDLSFYDYGTHAQVMLRIADNKVHGYNYKTRSHFNGHISGQNLFIRDYKARQNYTYIF